MKMYVDFDQYLLTAGFLAPSVVLCHWAVCGIAKLLAKLTDQVFSLSVQMHLCCIIAACAGAPIVALRFINRPADLQGSGLALLAGAISSLLVVSIVETLGRKPRG